MPRYDYRGHRPKALPILNSAFLAGTALALGLSAPALAQDTAAPVEMAGPAASGPSGEPAEQPVPGQLHNAQAIASFLSRLPTAAGAMPPLSVVQIGDSHTAGDTLGNGWRQRWQAEYGAGGRGTMVVGKPYQGYITWGVTAHQSPDWTVNSIFGRQHVADGPLLGLSGFTQTTTSAGATLSLTADSTTYLFDHFSLCGLTGPDKGRVRITLGSVTQDHDFAAPEAGATCFDMESTVPVGSASIITLDAKPVNLTSWESRRQAGGVIISNLGVVGSRFVHFTRNDDRVLGLELRHAHPDLLVIAFGTNEGFDPSLKLDEAEATMRGQIARLRRLLGYRVPILLVGPPDAASNRPDVALPSMPETVSCGGGWYVPGNLARIREMQMRLAVSMNLAFWDWQKAMGGACASSQWVAQGLQRGDHVHFTTQGGLRLGRALADDLDSARLRLNP